jgi:cytidine deaminase
LKFLEPKGNRIRHYRCRYFPNLPPVMQSFQHYNSIDALDAESKYLTHKAKEALGHAYAPYSHFHVAAAVLFEDGEIVLGTNQENAAYPSGLCAERVAVFAAQSQHPEKVIKKIAIVARKKNHKELTPAAACGACRQVMLEAEMRQKKEIVIIMLTAPQQWTVASSAASLLPLAFSKLNITH